MATAKVQGTIPLPPLSPCFPASLRSLQSPDFPLSSAHVYLKMRSNRGPFRSWRRRIYRCMYAHFYMHIPSLKPAFYSGGMCDWYNIPAANFDLAFHIFFGQNCNSLPLREKQGDIDKDIEKQGDIDKDIEKQGDIDKDIEKQGDIDKDIGGGWKNVQVVDPHTGFQSCTCWCVMNANMRYVWCASAFIVPHPCGTVCAHFQVWIGQGEQMCTNKYCDAGLEYCWGDLLQSLHRFLATLPLQVMSMIPWSRTCGQPPPRLK